MVQQDVGQRLLAFRCVERSQVNACVGKGLIGRSEERKRSGALQGFEQFSLNDGRHEAVVDGCALSGPGQVVWCVRWREDLVNDVNHAVAGGHVGHGDVCVVDHHAPADREGERLSIGRGCGHALGHVGRGNVSLDDVIQQNVSQGGFALGRVKRSQIDASVCEGLVRRCKHRERAVALEGFEQFCLDDGSHKTVVNRGALRRARDVFGGVRRHQHLVDDVDQPVAGDDVGEDHVGVVDHHATVHGERKRLAVGGVRGHALRHVSSRHIGTDHVVEQDVGERGLSFRCGKIGQINTSVGERLVCGCEHRERSGPLQRGQKFCLDHSGHEAVVDARGLSGGGDVDRRKHDLVDDVDDAVGGDDVGGGDVGVADGHAVGVDAKLNPISVHGRGEHAVGERA